MSHRKDDLTNLYKSQFESVFSNDKNQIIEFAKKLEEYTYTELPIKISEYFNVNDDKDIPLIMSLIIALVHNHLHHNEKWVEELSASSLTNDIKKNIYEFTKTLSKKTLNKLNLFYLSDLQMHNELTHISALNEELSFKLIYNDNGDVVGQLPVVSLKLITKKDDDTVAIPYILTVKDLISITNIFNSIIDKQNKIINEYKEKFGDSLVV